MIGCVGILAVLGLFVMIAASRSGTTATPTGDVTRTSVMPSAVVAPAPVTVTVTDAPAPVDQPTVEAGPAAAPAPGGDTNYVPVPVPNGDGYCHTCDHIPHPSFGHHGHLHF